MKKKVDVLVYFWTRLLLLFVLPTSELLMLLPIVIINKSNLVTFKVTLSLKDLHLLINRCLEIKVLLYKTFVSLFKLIFNKVFNYTCSFEFLTHSLIN